MRQTTERQQPCGCPLLRHVQYGKETSCRPLHGIARSQAILQSAERMVSRFLERLHTAPIAAQALRKLLPRSHLRVTDSQLGLQVGNVSVCACADRRGGYVGSRREPLMIRDLPAVHHPLPLR
jgi:hypothetical protein